MKYLVVKNISLLTLIERKKGGGLMWENYGFNRDQLVGKVPEMGKTLQGLNGWDTIKKKQIGEDCGLYPIHDIDVFNSKFANLQYKVANNQYVGDFIKVLDDDSTEFQELKLAIEQSFSAAQEALA